MKRNEKGQFTTCQSVDNFFREMETFYATESDPFKLKDYHLFTLISELESEKESLNNNINKLNLIDRAVRVAAGSETPVKLGTYWTFSLGVNSQSIEVSLPRDRSTVFLSRLGIDSIHYSEQGISQKISLLINGLKGQIKKVDDRIDILNQPATD